MSVYNRLLHEKGFRLLGGILGAALMASAINLFIVPQGFYAGGAYGLCQVIRTLLVTRAGLSLPFDLAGLLYLLVNLPMFYLAYRGLGRTFFVKATIVTVCNSIFSALIPSPATPIIEDALTSCLIGGIGVGFAAARLRGSENNDPFCVENGKIVTKTNHCGGILGGISNGMPVVFRAAFKPTPSISREQDSVSLSRMEETKLVIHGRHDPCIVPRAVPCVEAAAAIAVLDAVMERKKELGYGY